MELTVEGIYKHRWLVSLIINVFVLACAAFFYLLPDFWGITNNQDIKYKLTNQLVLLKEKTNPIEIYSTYTPLSPRAATTFMLKFVEKHELQLQFIRQLDNALQLQVKGSYMQIGAFILNLYRANASIDAYQIVSNANGDVVTAEVNLSAVAANDEGVDKANKYQLKNPLCLKPNQSFDLNIHNVSINKLKWAGYLKHGKQEQALMSLPNNLMIAISLNDEIGIEQARVYLITPNYVELLLPNKSFFKISYQTK